MGPQRLAGSQRYPLHWGGDSGNSDVDMAATLRWSLVRAARLHRQGSRGTLPALGAIRHVDLAQPQPRRAAKLKYRLMPYVYAQATDASQRGLPMVRALFIEFPGDPGSWQIDDEYLFGSDMLAAPLFESGTTGRNTYLPPGQWVDYQSGKSYADGWHNIQAGQIPAVIPHIQIAPSTMQLDWSELELVVYSAEASQARGLVCLPSDNVLRSVEAAERNGAFALNGDPLAGKAALTVRGTLR